MHGSLDVCVGIGTFDPPALKISHFGGPLTNFLIFLITSLLSVSFLDSLSFDYALDITQFLKVSSGAILISHSMVDAICFHGFSLHLSKWHVLTFRSDWYWMSLLYCPTYTSYSSKPKLNSLFPHKPGSPPIVSEWASFLPFVLTKNPGHDLWFDSSPTLTYQVCLLWLIILPLFLHLHCYSSNSC